MALIAPVPGHSLLFSFTCSPMTQAVFVISSVKATGAAMNRNFSIRRITCLQFSNKLLSFLLLSKMLSVKSKNNMKDTTPICVDICIDHF